MVTLHVEGATIADVVGKLQGLGFFPEAAYREPGKVRLADPNAALSAVNERVAETMHDEPVAAEKPAKKTREAKVLPIKKEVQDDLPKAAELPATLDPTPAVLKPLTLEEVRAKVIDFNTRYSAYSKDETAGATAIQKLLRPFKVSRVSELPPDEFASFLEMLDTALPAAAK